MRLSPYGATTLPCIRASQPKAGGPPWGDQAAFYDKKLFAYADETRPRFQGARLTAWKVMKQDSSKLIPDSAAATLNRDGKSDWSFSGRPSRCQRDVANNWGPSPSRHLQASGCLFTGVPFHHRLSFPDGSQYPSRNVKQLKSPRAGVRWLL
jgi:methylthioribose-1-phosphate isomerase